MKSQNQIAVTGAGGFLGFALVKKLAELSLPTTAIIRSYDSRLKNIAGDINLVDVSTNLEKLKISLNNCQTVFHVASKVDMWGKYEDFYQANVVGTKNVIEACRSNAVRNLIYTSSPSVVADGNNLRNINESYPIPKHHHANYAATKAIAEKLVLDANSAELRTVALRPHLIFGPGDRHFVPSIVERARKGRLKIIGDGKNIVDLCYIEDCVDAHIAAMHALNSGKDCSGKAFFISQGQPFGLWDFINKILAIHGLKPLTQKIPKALAFQLAAIFEIISKISPFSIKPLLTKFLVTEMTTDHYFNISAAKELLGFEPKYTIEQALNEIQKSLTA